MAKNDNPNLLQLVEQKEKEWKEAQELRYKSMELSLKEHEKLLNNERIRFRKLKEDFGYNLTLLAERDQELERYDLLFSKYKTLESERNGEVSDLKIKLDDLHNRLLQEQNSREDLQKYYQQRLKEHKQEIQQFAIAKDSEVKKERDSLEKFKRELQLQLRSAEEDMERQRHLIMSGYDDELHKREHEYRLKTDEMGSRLLEYELKTKMLSKEVEILRSYEERTKTDLQSTESTVQELEKKLKQKEWELMDCENMHNAKLTEMELEVRRVQAALKKSQDTFQHKQSELDRYAKEKETALLACKETHQQRERQLEDTIHNLQTKLDTTEYRRLEWEVKDAEKCKQYHIDKLQKTISDLEERLSSQATKFSQSSVSKDLELEALRQQEEKLRMDIIQKTADMERYKKDLALATERELNHERVKTQMELDWQRRYEDAEREAYEKQEDLIRNLTRTKDEAVATAKEKDRELQQREHLIKILTQTRDQALATLQRHGLSVPIELPSKEESGYEFSESLSNEEKIKMYEEQNQNLRDVIRQMRQDMEELNNQLASRPPSVIAPDDSNNSSVPLTSEYVKSLEKEIRELKAKNRTLSKRLEEIPLVHKPPTGPGNDQVKSLGKIDDPFVQSHVKELNDTIGVLRQDKLQLSAEVRKHEGTIAHLRSLLNNAQDEVRQKQVTVEQAQYELNTLSRRSSEETTALKQRVSELELLLTQVRREADEYFKNGLERNLEATALGNQLSTLKLELASQGKSTSSFHPQSSVINQLQDEIQKLQKQIKYGPTPMPPSDNNVARLQAKLNTAVQRITQLVREKDQLIQMGNKLRAELSRYQGSKPQDSFSKKDPTSHLINKPTTPKPVTITPDEMTDQLQNKLSAMEKLQYALTSHELQVAQRMAEQQMHAAEQAQINMKSSSSESSPVEGHDVRRKDQENPLRSQRAHSSNSLQSHRKEPLSAASVSQRHSSPNQDHALFTSSSEGQPSLQEVWKLLDEEESFRSLSPVKERARSQSPDDIPVREESESSSGFTIKGKKTSLDVKSQKPRPELSKKALGKMKMTPKKSTIRNYNVRDDKTWKKGKT